jgi:hypothetical protein
MIAFWLFGLMVIITIKPPRKGVGSLITIGSSKLPAVHCFMHENIEKLGGEGQGQVLLPCH